MRVTCRRCTHQWDYGGRRNYSTICPECGGRVSLRTERPGGVSLSAYMGLASPVRREALRSAILSLHQSLAPRLHEIDSETLLLLLDSFIMGIDRALERSIRQRSGRLPGEAELAEYWKNHAVMMEPHLKEIAFAYLDFGKDSGNLGEDRGGIPDDRQGRSAVSNDDVLEELLQ